MSFLPFRFSLDNSLSAPVKSLKVARSDHAHRPSFHNGIDAFSTPSSTPETPASWPPRPALTCLSPTCLDGHSCRFVHGNRQKSYFVKAIRFYTGAIPFLNFWKPPVHFQKPPTYWNSFAFWPFKGLSSPFWSKVWFIINLVVVSTPLRQTNNMPPPHVDLNIV